MEKIKWNSRVEESQTKGFSEEILTEAVLKEKIQELEALGTPDDVILMQRW